MTASGVREWPGLVVDGANVTIPKRLYQPPPLPDGVGSGPPFVELTAQRASSYWAEYHCGRYPDRADYPGLAVLRALAGQWPRKASSSHHEPCGAATLASMSSGRARSPSTQRPTAARSPADRTVTASKP